MAPHKCLPSSLIIHPKIRPLLTIPTLTPYLRQQQLSPLLPTQTKVRSHEQLHILFASATPREINRLHRVVCLSSVISSHLISSQLCLLLTRAPHPRKSCQSSSHPTSTAFPHSCLFFFSPHINSHVTVCETSTINHLYHSTLGLDQHRDFVQPPILMQTPFPTLVQRRDGSSLSKNNLRYHSLSERRINTTDNNPAPQCNLNKQQRGNLNLKRHRQKPAAQHEKHPKKGDDDVQYINTECISPPTTMLFSLGRRLRQRPIPQRGGGGICHQTLPIHIISIPPPPPPPPPSLPKLTSHYYP